MKVNELKLWLKDNQVTVTGKKKDLIKRIKDYILVDKEENKKSCSSEEADSDDSGNSDSNSDEESTSSVGEGSVDAVNGKHEKEQDSINNKNIEDSNVKKRADPMIHVAESTFDFDSIINTKTRSVHSKIGHRE